MVITNELTTRVTTEGDTEIVPALGESHSHRVNYQVTFGRDQNNRKLFVANIDKCFMKGEAKVPFAVSENNDRKKKQNKKDREKIFTEMLFLQIVKDGFRRYGYR